MFAWLFAIASTMSLPLWSVVVLISRPCAAKNPLLMPSVSGRPFAIGSVSSVIVVSAWRCGELAAVPLKSVATTTPTAMTTAPRRTPPLLSCMFLLLCSCENFFCRRLLLAADQTVDVGAKAGELGQLLRRDLVAG